MQFEFKLALALHRTRQELLASISNEEFQYWLARELIDPLPDSYWQSGLVSSTFVNVFKDKKAKPATIADFLPVRPETKKMSVNEIANHLRTVKKSHT